MTLAWRELADMQGNILRGYRHLHYVAYTFWEIDEDSVEDVRALLAYLTESDAALHPERVMDSDPTPQPDEVPDPPYSLGFEYPLPPHLAPAPERVPRFSVMSAEPWEHKAWVHEALNVAFTAKGLEKLGWDGRFARYPEFMEGMAERASYHLGDDADAVNSWERGLKDEADLLFTLYCRTRSLRETRVMDLCGMAAAASLERLYVQLAGRITHPPTAPPGSLGDEQQAPAAADERHEPGEPCALPEADGRQTRSRRWRPGPHRPARGDGPGRRRRRKRLHEPVWPPFGAREHFGFRDGFSQPALPVSYNPDDVDPRGEGVLMRPWTAGCRWRPLQLGEFILGHLDEDRQVPGDPDDESPHKNGTFMVWRKLSQDVDAFDEYVDKAAYPSERAAKLVGRWQDGASLVQAPYAAPIRPAKGVPSNDFDYTRDLDGARCPVGAHVRRANPRAALGWGTERTRRHRIIRRGMPYGGEDPEAAGERLPAGRVASDGDPGDRGLVFVCFNASIKRQFEQIQGNWLADGDAFGRGGEADPLLGGPDAVPISLQGARGGEPLRLLELPQRPLVTPRGGYYLFVPSLSLLRRMAAGKGPGPPKMSGLMWLVGALGAAFSRRGLD